MKNKNNIDEVIREFNKDFTYSSHWYYKGIFAKRKDFITFLKQKLQQVEQKKVEEIIDDIEKIKNAVRVSTGSFKYDSCYNDVLNLKSLTKE